MEQNGTNGTVYVYVYVFVFVFECVYVYMRARAHKKSPTHFFLKTEKLKKIFDKKIF